jgi:cell division septation protein DedD
MRRLIFLLIPILLVKFQFAQVDTSKTSVKNQTVTQAPPEEPVGDPPAYLLPAATALSITPVIESRGPVGLPMQDTSSNKSTGLVLGDNFHPKVALGVGMFSFIGDLDTKHYQAPWTARIAYDLNLSHRLTNYLQINFNVLFGKLGAYENRPDRHENFQSEIRAGGLNLMYDFGNFIPERYGIRPWISLGITGFEFLSKTDLYDKNGEQYYYWSDGSIKNMPEGSAGSQFAKDLVRDYQYETDIRERNIDGFGKYQERSWAMPVGFGAIMKISDRFDFKVGVQYYFTATDYIDGITEKSVGNRAGTKNKDKFVYTSVALQYDLTYNKRTKDTMPKDYFDNLNWLALDASDYDKDGVRDFDDKCQGTPEAVKVDQFGCPLDDDGDKVPNYMDDENPSPKGFEVNMHGVALTDDFWQSWYDHYFDSIGIDKTTEVLGNAALAGEPEKPKQVVDEKRVYTVELARYKGGVPSDEMAFLLSIGDIKSTTLDDGTTVVYTAGTYDDVMQAVKRRDEYIAEGNKSSRVSYFKGEKLFELSDDELAKLMKAGLSGSVAVNTSTSTAGTSTTTAGTSTTTAGTSTTTANTNVGGSSDFVKGGIVYRVQLGAYKNRISIDAFKSGAGVVELKTEDNYYRYVTQGYKTISDAAKRRADLVVMGYTDAFVTAYKDGKRIAMDKAGATMATTEKEDLNENKTFSTVDKSLVGFKIQIGALKRPGPSNDMEDRLKDVKGVDKQTTATGQIRYTYGNFKDQQSAEKARQELEDMGFPEAFIIATFKGEVISIQEAMELLK